jgi:sterol desaturase/sphingolipid hydroxylase (fatty acid hydroxylase superfamily)
MVDARELKMAEGERLWWERVRRRGAMWYVVNKGLLFLLAYPAIGCFAIGWEWQPTLLLEGWYVGLVCGGFVWMRKELRYRFTLDEEGLALPDGRDE